MEGDPAALSSADLLNNIAVKFLLIRYPPTKNPYQHLKDRLLRVYALYNYACAKAIANLPVSGDMQTSSLMSWVMGLPPLVHTLVSS